MKGESIISIKPKLWKKVRQVYILICTHIYTYNNITICIQVTMGSKLTH